jgi:hypothetical protein
MLIRLSLLFADLPVPEPPPGTVREKADQILRDAQFQHSTSKSPIRRLLDWLGDQISVPFSAASGGNNVVGLLIVLAFVGLLVYVLSRVRFSLPRSLSDIDADDVDVATDEDRPADALRNEAEAAEAAGEWKLALRARYRWLLGELFERQVLTSVPGRTPGEYRQDIARAMPEQSADFARATDLFERAWYGNEQTDQDETEQFRACADRVIAATDRVLV